MTPKERIENLTKGLPVDRPPFFPAIYDYKATLAGVDLHYFGQNKVDLEYALSREVQDLHAEMLTSAFDIYNIEAEAVGGIIARVKGTGMPEIRLPLIRNLDEVKHLSVPSCMSGRMEIFVKAAQSADRNYGGTIQVRGGISGPFSMASKIFPREDLLMLSLTDPESVMDLLRFCTDVIKVYLKGFLNLGLGAAIFDSFISPPMLSPELYSHLVLPLHRELFDAQKARGVKLLTLIAGGNTIPLLPALMTCGANQFLLDYNIPLEQVNKALSDYPEMLFRINLSPALFTTSPEEIKNEVKKVLSVIGGRKNLIMGTGILNPGTPKNNILAAREAIMDYYGV